MNNPKPKGFSTMDPARVKEIQSMGGKAAHAKGTAHRFTPEEAQAAGRKGGMARAANLAAQRAGGQSTPRPGEFDPTVILGK